MSQTLGSNINFALISQLLSLGSADAIIIPKDYRDKVLQVKKLLQNDISGIANSVLDFAIECALVNYEVEANGKTADLYNDWLDNINISLNGQIPVGIRALAKQYFIERWKGSSHLLLNTRWENVDGYMLPTVIYLVDGEDIVVKSDPNTYTEIGKIKYAIRTSNDSSKDIPLPQKAKNKIFIQKPYESWSTYQPTPFTIKRGVYQNIKMLELITKKGENVVHKALEYMLLLKKGDKDLVKNNLPEFAYNREELTGAKEGLKKVIADSKIENGIPTYATNFDTDLSHFIPDYTKVISKDIYSPFEKRILQGLGMIEIVEGTSSSRQQSILNPKPLTREIYSGINDFKEFLNNIIISIKQENKKEHRNFSNTKTRMKDTIVQAFATMDDKTILRGIYDRGGLSKETYVELSGDVNFESQVEKRKNEKKRGLDIDLFPPVTQNTEKDVTDDIDAPDNKKKIDTDTKEKNENDNKDGVEKKNFTRSLEEFKCPHCANVFDFESQPEISIDKANCPECKKEVSRPNLNKAFYTKKNYPDTIKNLPAGARTIWIDTFNAIFEETDDEDAARKAAWSNVKKKYKKNKDGKWKKKSKAEIQKSSVESPKETNSNLDDLIKLKKLEVLEKQEKVLSKIDKESK